MGEIHFDALNGVDIVILVIFAVSILMGFGRGLIHELLSLLVLIAAIVVAILFSNQLAEFFNQTAAANHAASDQTSHPLPISYLLLGVSFGVLFIGTIIIGSVIKWLLHLVIGSGVFGFGNRLLGGIFGLIRGYLVNLVLIFLLELSPFISQPWVTQSQFIPFFQPQVEWLGRIVSPTLSNLKETFTEKNKIENTTSSPEKSETKVIILPTKK